MLDDDSSQSSAFLQFLVGEAKLTDVARRRAFSALQSSSERIETILLELGMLAEGDLLQSLAKFLNCKVMPDPEISEEALDVLKVDGGFLTRNLLVPISLSGGELEIATSHPLDCHSAELLAYTARRRLKVVVSTQRDVSRALSELSGVKSTTAADDGGDLLEVDADRLRDLASEAPTIRLLNRIVTSAVERGASDIHIEPVADHVRARFRIDGVLQVAETIDKAHQAGLVSRVKVLAQLNIAEQRLPQDGRIRFVVKGREIDFRVSTAPAIDGESVVLRILDKGTVSVSFPALGFSEAAIRQLRSLESEPNGIVLVTGPTGSGKTTTLYSALRELNAEEKKIFTIEDPVEYHLEGITQIPIRPQIGLEFSSILRSVLRQDPDIIMVGEIRDSETARIAVQASLTGHLVLSTLHTNSSVSSITRLRDLGLENYLIAATLRGVISQRLVRKSCPNCLSGSITAPPTDPTKRHQRRAECSNCGGTGLKGRTVVYEILSVTDAVREAVSQGAAEAGIAAIAIQEGMVPIAECAEAMVANGVTTSDEVLRSLGSILQ